MLRFSECGQELAFELAKRAKSCEREPNTWSHEASADYFLD
jgi:hypothetical protein